MAASRQPHRRSSRRPRNMETSRSKQPRPDSPRTSGSQSIALGLERIGFISLRFPLLGGLATLVLLMAAGFGLARIKVDDSLSQLFRSDTPEFKTFEEVTRRFPSNEYDVLIVVEGKSLLERASIEKLRDLVTDLQLIDVRKGHHLDIFGAVVADRGGPAVRKRRGADGLLRMGLSATIHFLN